MNPLARIWNAARSMLSKPGNRASHWYYPNTAGIRIDDFSALNHSAVFACVRGISETIGGLPWHVIEHDGDSRTRRPDHPVEAICNKSANPETPAGIWRETILAHALLTGNGYAEIVRNARREPAELWIVEPHRVEVTRDNAGRLVYDVRNDTGPNTVLPSGDMFHLRGMGYDGVVGYSIVSLARRAMGLGQALEQFGSDFFANGASFSGLLKNAGSLTAQKREELRREFSSKKTAAGERKTIAVLSGQMEYQQMGTPPEDAQFLESMRFSVETIARWFRVPPHWIGHLERATFNNIESLSIDVVRYCLAPWTRRLEQEASAKLISTKNRGRLEPKIQLEGIMAGDSQARAEYYRQMMEVGAFTIDDILRLEDMDPVGGDVGSARFVPANWIPVERAIEEPEPQPMPFATEPGTVTSDDEPATEEPVEQPPAAAHAAIRIMLTDAVGRASRKTWRKAERKPPEDLKVWAKETRKDWIDHIFPTASAAHKLFLREVDPANLVEQPIVEIANRIRNCESIEPTEEWIGATADRILASWELTNGTVE